MALVASAWSPRIRLEEPGLVREHHCLHAVTEVELLEDVVTCVLTVSR